MSTGFRTFFFCSFFAAFSLAVYADDGLPEGALSRGFNAQSAFAVSDVDQVNQSNGNLVLSVPIGQNYVVGPSLSYQLSLVYNSNVWDFLSALGIVKPQDGVQPKTQTVAVASPQLDANAGLGWKLSLGELYAPANILSGTPVFNINTTINWIYVAGDGSRHRFHHGLHPNYPDPDPDTNFTPGAADNDLTQYATDGTYLRMLVLSATHREIDSPDGTVREFDCNQSIATTMGCWRLTKIRDHTSVNFVSIDYVTDGAGHDITWTLSDSFGRKQVITFASAPGMPLGIRLQSVALTAFQGQTATYTFNYNGGSPSAPQSDTPIFQDCHPSLLMADKLLAVDSGFSNELSASVTVPLLSSITLPDNSTFTFQDDSGPTPTANPDNTPSTRCVNGNGRLSSATYPTGAKATWQYGGYYSFENANCFTLPETGDTPHPLPQHSSYTTGVRQKTVTAADGSSLGSWTYLTDTAVETFGDTSIIPPYICKQTIRSTASVVIDASHLAKVSYFTNYKEDNLWYTGNHNIDLNNGQINVGWSDDEYGQNFTRYDQVVGENGRQLFLQDETYQCPSSFNASDFSAGASTPILRNTIENIINGSFRYYSPVLLATCGAPLRATYVAYETDAKANGDLNAIPAYHTPSHKCEGYVRPPGVEGDNLSFEAISCGETNPRVVEERKLFAENGGSNFIDTVYDDYDGLGHYRQAETSTNFPNSPKQTTQTNYNPGLSSTAIPIPTSAWMLGNYSTQAKSQGGYQALTDFCFDPNLGSLLRTRLHRMLGISDGSDPNGPPAGTPVSACDPAKPSTDPNIPTCNTAANANDIVSVNTLDANGFVGVTRMYGGDLHPLALPAAPDKFCNASLQGAPGSVMPEYQKRIKYQYGAVMSDSWVVPTQYSAILTSADNDPSVLLPIANNTVDLNTGLVFKSVDTSGVTKSAKYDTSGRMLEKSGDGMATTTYAYSLRTSGDANSVSETVMTQTSTTPLKSTYSYDDLGRLTRADSPYLSKTDASTELPLKDTASKAYFYDVKGRKIAESVLSNNQGAIAQPASSCMPGQGNVYTYDPLDRLLSTTKPDCSVAMSTYGPNNRIDATTYVGDRATTRTTYKDAAGNLAQVIELSGPDDAATTTDYTYDVNGKLRYVNVQSGSASQIRHFDYDAIGWSIGSQIPELDMAPVTSSGYDSLGHPSETTWSYNSRKLQTTFDSVGRPSQITSVLDPLGPRLLEEYFYAAPGSSSDQDKKGGKLILVKRHNYLPANPSQPTQNIFDYVVSERLDYTNPAGLLTTSSMRIAALNPAAADSFGLRDKSDLAFRATSQYDDLGQVSRIDYPDCAAYACPTGALPALSVSNSYFNNELTSVRATVGTSPPQTLALFGYFANGLQAEVDHPLANATLAREIWELDTSYNGSLVPKSPPPNNIARVGEILITLGDYQTSNATIWDSGAYDYDASGNILGIGLNSYDYDLVSRLTSGTVVSPFDDSKYSSQTAKYDGFGNLTSLTTDGVTSAFNVDPLSNRLLGNQGTSSFAYDAFGNTALWSHPMNGTTSGPIAFQNLRPAFDALNAETYIRTDVTASLAPGSVRSQRASKFYVYGPDNKRVGILDTVLGTQRWTLRGSTSKVLREFTRDNTNAISWSRDYTYAEARQLTSYTPGDSGGGIRVLHYFPDHLGSTRVVLDRNGGVVAQYAYASYGQIAFQVDQLPGIDGNHLFTGHERDYNTADHTDDFDYMLARNYVPNMGRFLSMDAASGDAASPRSWNKYAYVSNNPLNRTDPTGNHEEPGHGGLSYRLIMAAGMLERDAATFALACAGVDHNPATSPLNGWNLVEEFLVMPFMPPGTRSPITYYHFPSQQEAVGRVDFEISQRPMSLYTWGVATHSEEDVGFPGGGADGPHKGFFNVGHPWGFTEAGDFSFPLNHTADLGDENPTNNRQLFLNVFAQMIVGTAAYYGRPMHVDYAAAEAAIEEYLSADTAQKIHTFLEVIPPGATRSYSDQVYYRRSLDREIDSSTPYK